MLDGLEHRQRCGAGDRMAAPVDPWANIPASPFNMVSITSLEAMSPPNGSTADVTPFAKVITSGLMP